MLISEKLKLPAIITGLPKLHNVVIYKKQKNKSFNLNTYGFDIKWCFHILTGYSTIDIQ